ncbi:hypothetical protein EHP00_414 [Ecytonucleospora hepatopenaei]|uniref:Uncharacterized protein n=1 Tax=Ecytonucleospora hepatopenaei TaxID=646526 RepID=A0A1W0E9E0_9MICR|nr:hypothetical protein EHP00_414 [Ecytonucleospora hepatopenaei]
MIWVTSIWGAHMHILASLNNEFGSRGNSPINDGFNFITDNEFFESGRQSADIVFGAANDVRSAVEQFFSSSNVLMSQMSPADQNSFRESMNRAQLPVQNMLGESNLPQGMSFGSPNIITNQPQTPMNPFQPPVTPQTPLNDAFISPPAPMDIPVVAAGNLSNEPNVSTPQMNPTTGPSTNTTTGANSSRSSTSSRSTTSSRKRNSASTVLFVQAVFLLSLLI